MNLRVDGPLEIIDLGKMAYSSAHEEQLKWVEELANNENLDDKVLLTEHPSVFTLGRSGSLASLIKSKKDIVDRGVQIIHTERGGDITYHGPGQLVAYPIVNLRRRGLSVTEFVHLLEEIMIRTSKDFEVSAQRDLRNRGIWVGDNKIGSIGIRIRRGISFHGLALNINLSLGPFSWIQPCGLQGVGVSSLELESNTTISMDDAKKRMIQHIKSLLL